MAGLAFTVLCMVVAVAAAIGDIRLRRIPNWLCLCMFAAALGLILATGGLSALGSHFGHALLALLIGMGLFAAGMIGGGDAKFYAACAFALPITKAHYLLGWTSLGGLLLLIAMMVLKRRLPRKGPDGKSAFTVPYGVAIAIGLVASLLPDLQIGLDAGA